MSQIEQGIPRQQEISMGVLANNHPLKLSLSLRINWTLLDFIAKKQEHDDKSIFKTTHVHTEKGLFAVEFLR